MLTKIATTCILAVALAAASLAHAATPEHSAPFNSAYIPLSKLPPLEQRAVLLAALGDVDQNNNTLEQKTPEQQTDVLKIGATQYKLGSELAAAIGWDELASILAQGHNILSSRIRGEVSSTTATHALDTLESNFHALRIAAARQFDQASLGIPTSANANDARRAIATYLNAGSRMLVWGQQPHTTPTKLDPTTRKALARDAQTFRVKMLQAADTLARLPKSERTVALLDAGGSINVFIKTVGKHAHDQPDAKKHAALITGANALDQLAGLAKTLGFNDAAQCHTVEANNLRAMAQGIAKTPTGCREKAYPPALRNAAIRTAQGPRGQTIDDMTQQWVNAASFFSSLSADSNDDNA